MAVELLNITPIVSTRGGGTSAFVGAAARELERRGNRVLTIATDIALAPGGRPQHAVRTDEIHPAIAAGTYELYPTRPPRRLLYSPALGRGVRAAVRTADVVHIHMLWLYPQYIGAAVARRGGVPYIVSPHGSLDPAVLGRGRMRKLLTTQTWQRKMLERASLIHVTTPVEAELIADVAPSVPRALVPAGIELDQFRQPPPREVFRRERLDGYEGPVILFLSRITWKKGIDLLIRAFALVRRERECRLVIAGFDDERLTPSLRTLAEREGVADRVDFVGALSDDERLAAFASADVWALSSLSENFGIAVVEAMVAGCPVVISPAVNLAPGIHEADAGLVAELTPAATAAALNAILGDAQLSERLRANGRRYASRYEISVVASELEQMYARAITG